MSGRRQPDPTATRTQIAIKFGISGGAATTAVEHGGLDYAPGLPDRIASTK